MALFLRFLVGIFLFRRFKIEINLTQEEIEDLLMNLYQCNSEGYLNCDDHAYSAMIKLQESIKLIPLHNDKSNLPNEEIPVTCVIVTGRKEHEEMLKDEAKLIELGLDPVFEKIVYLRRWGGWLKDERKADR